MKNVHDLKLYVFVHHAKINSVCQMRYIVKENDIVNMEMFEIVQTHHTRKYHELKVSCSPTVQAMFLMPLRCTCK